MAIFNYEGIERREIADFGQAVIDSMNAHVAVVDHRGDIILVNKAWKSFMQQSCDDCIDHLDVGANYWCYLNSCMYQSCDAYANKAKILEAMQAITKGELTEFTLEYPCPGPLGEHWFLLSATPLNVWPSGVVISHIDITERCRSEKALAEANQLLRRLSSRLEELLEEERARIAREMHDELGQRLTALRMELTWVGSRLGGDQTILQAKMAELIKLTDATTKVVQQIASDLRPTMLDDLGPMAAIEWLTEDFSKRTGIGCQLRLEPIDLDGDDALATGIFRMVQESLTNVARHAEATQAIVHIYQLGSTLVLSIQDNGKGISDTALNQKDTLGLLGMKERAKMLGGSAEINRQLEGGTEVKISLPLVAKAKLSGENR